MPENEFLDKISIHVPQEKMKNKPVERLIKLSEKKDRSIDDLVVDAILQYVDREEGPQPQVAPIIDEEEGLEGPQTGSIVG